jgi:hypothetical protein
MLSFPNQSIVYKNNFHAAAIALFHYAAAARCRSGDVLALKIEDIVGRQHTRSESIRRIELI